MLSRCGSTSPPPAVSSDHAETTPEGTPAPEKSALLAEAGSPSKPRSWWRQPIRPWVAVAGTLLAGVFTLAALHLVWLSQWSAQSRGYSTARSLSPREEGAPLVPSPTLLALGLRSAAHGRHPTQVVAQWLEPTRAPWAPSLGVTGARVTWEGVPSDDKVPATDRTQLLAAYQPARDVIHMRADLDPVLEQQVLLHEMIHRLQYQVGPDLASWWETLDPDVPMEGLYAAAHPREHQAEAGSLAWGWLVWCRQHPRAAIGQISRLEHEVPGVRAWGELWLALSVPTPTRPVVQQRGDTDDEAGSAQAQLPGEGCVEVLRAGLSAEHMTATHHLATIIQRHDRTGMDRRPLWRHLRGILTVRQPGDSPWRWLLETIGDDPALAATQP